MPRTKLRNRVDLTPNQSVTLAFIKSQLAECGKAPTLMQIARKLGHSTLSGANYVLDSLESKGHIRRKHGVARGIEVVETKKAKRAK